MSIKSKKVRVLHLLSSNEFSGAENVVCQIMKMCEDQADMIYCSPSGKIEKQINEKFPGIRYVGIEKLSVKEVKKVIKQFKPDIIHAHDIRASVIAAFCKRREHLVSHIHGSDIKNMARISKKSVAYLLVQWKINKIIWVSQSCLDSYRFRRCVRKKSVILYNIINSDAVIKKAKDKTNATNENYDIIWLARLVDVKNPIRMLGIVKQLKKNRNDIKVAILGDGNLRQKCEEYVKENGLSKNVKFFGFLDNPYSVLADGKLLIMSSISEGTPMCALEALTLGKPVVSTPTDGLKDIIVDGENGYLYSSDQEAVECIESVLNDYKRFEKKCIDFSLDYNDKKKYLNKLMGTYENKK